MGSLRSKLMGDPGPNLLRAENLLKSCHLKPYENQYVSIVKRPTARRKLANLYVRTVRARATRRTMFN